MEALHDVVRAGKARYIGASSMFAWQFAKAQHVAERHGWTRFVSMQNHYNLIYREEEREMIPLCLDQGVGVIPWSPLARGVLAGNRTRAGERHDDPRRTPTRSPTTSTASPPTSTSSSASPRSPPSAASAGAGRARVAAAQAGRDRADRRRHQARAPQDALAAEQLDARATRRSRAWRSPTRRTRARARVGRRDAAMPHADEMLRVAAARAARARRAGAQPAPAAQGGGARVHGHAHRPVPDARPASAATRTSSATPAASSPTTRSARSAPPSACSARRRSSW